MSHALVALFSLPKECLIALLSFIDFASLYARSVILYVDRWYGNLCSISPSFTLQSLSL